eukprot:169102-Prymnesium_polylepis.1
MNTNITRSIERGRTRSPRSPETPPRGPPTPKPDATPQPADLGRSARSDAHASAPKHRNSGKRERSTAKGHTHK